MATCTIEVLAVQTHVNVELFVWFEKRGVHIPMFDAVAAATEEMTGTTIVTRRSGNALGNLVPFGWQIFFFVSRKNFWLLYRIASPGWELLIGSRLLMADKTVYFRLIRKIEIFTLPPISSMTRCATSLVALDIHSEIIDR